MSMHGDKVSQAHITWVKTAQADSLPCVDLPVWIFVHRAMWALVVRLCLAHSSGVREAVFMQRLREVVKLQSAVAYMHACVS